MGDEVQGLASLVRYSSIPWILAFFCCLNSKAGVDHGQYLKWASAAVSGDIQKLENEKDLKGVSGVPLSPWSAGPGLLSAPLFSILSGIGLESGAGLITGYICVIVFWCSFFQALRLLAGEKLAVTGCLLAAIGTPVGYYCSSISSETFSLAFASYLFLQTVRAWKNRDFSPLGIAVATSLLLMMRSYLGVYAWPALVAGYVRSKQKSFFVLASLVCIGMAIIQIGSVNFWMTGSWSTNAYTFGDSQFQSFDWSAPYLFNVLFDSFHGWIPSHPLVALGTLCVLVLIVDSVKGKRRIEALLWSIFLLAIVINVYVQSCWFYWWLAMPSFGMRGLVLTSLPTVMAVVRLAFRIQVGLKQQRKRQGQGEVNQKCHASSKTRLPCSPGFDLVTSPSQDHVSNNKWNLTFLYAFWILTAASALYGWIHHCTGPTNCPSYSDLTIVFLNTLIGWGTITSLICIGCAWWIVRATDVSDRKSQDSLHQFTGLLFLLFMAVSIREFICSEVHWTFVISLIFFSILTFWMVHHRQTILASAGRVLVPATLFFALFFFTRLYIETSQVIQSFSVAKVETSKRDFNWPDTRRAYLTLNQVPRFRSQATAIRSFLERRFSSEFVERELVAMESSLSPELTVTRNLEFFASQKSPD